MSFAEIKDIPMDAWFTAIGIIAVGYFALKFTCLIVYSVKWSFIDMKYVYKLNRKHGNSAVRIIFALSLSFFVSVIEIAIDRLNGRERTA